MQPLFFSQFGPDLSVIFSSQPKSIAVARERREPTEAFSKTNHSYDVSFTAVNTSKTRFYKLPAARFSQENFKKIKNVQN